MILLGRAVRTGLAEVVVQEQFAQDTSGWIIWEAPARARAASGQRLQGWERSGQELLLLAEQMRMEPDDLLCSRNARPPKALVGRAQWEII